MTAETKALQPYKTVILAPAVFIGLYAANLYNYLLFHSLAEMLSVIIGCGAFFIAWNSRRFLTNNYLLFIGIAYLLVAAFDLAHTLSYAGVGDLSGYDPNDAAQLWISARYSQAISLVVAPLLLTRRLNPDRLLIIFSAIFAMIIGSIFVWDIFPVCYAEGIGVTPFKITSEFLICLILLASMGMLLMYRDRFDQGVLKLLIWSIIFAVGSELAFTLYTSVYGLANLIGHYFKIVSFYFIYKAVIETGLREPYDLLFRELKSAHDELEDRVRERTADLQSANQQLTAEIAERTRLEVTASRAGRALQTLIDFNHVLVRAHKESVLLNEICRILVEVGGYRMAWVGFVHVNDTRYVAPVAQAGYEAGYLVGLKIALTDEHQRQCPVARTLLSGKLSVVRDVLANPNAVACLQLARERDYGSLAVLPLRLDERVLGGLSIWAKEPDAFDPDELKPLAELAEDLSFGIAAIQTRAEQQKAHENLRLSEERYSGVVQDQSELICRFSSDKTISFVNEAFCAYFGKQYHEILREDFIQFISAEDRRRLEEYLSSATSETPVSNFENRIIRLDGSVRWCHWSVRSISNQRGEIVEFQAVGRDITDRKLAEQELRLSEARFRAVFESASDNIFIKDLFLRYTHVNQSMEKLLGLPSSKIIGRTVEELFDAEVSAYIRDAEKRVLQGEVVEGEYTRNISGISMIFNEIRAPLRNSSGDIVALCGILRDITDRRTREWTPGSTPETYSSKIMRETISQARLAAVTESVILLLGESGSGKDYLARHIHEHSKRRGGPFFSTNCAAVPPELTESELFGHEKGAFNGAHGRKRGLLELAEGGTLLLNEIGELSHPLQDKLLTFLDDRQFTRVGGEKKISINARIIAATNRDLEKEVRAGRFRQDLFHRISIMNIVVPPLRQRAEDIPILADEILSMLAKDLELNHIPAINDSTMDSLLKYHWPGNVRELRNVLERGLMLWDGVNPDFPLPSLIPGQTEWSRQVTFPTPGRSLRDITDEITKALCVEALQRCKGNKRDAARLLGIARDSLYRYMKEFGIESEISAEG